MRRLPQDRSTACLLRLKPHVHFFGGQGIGWALDEDLTRARAALGGQIATTSFARARLIHSAWWPPLLEAGARALDGKSVVCFADNPPAFYLTRPGFEQAASRVDLWIARSGEAVAQFRELGLPVAFAPYTVDAAVFRPAPPAERLATRRKLGIGEEDFVVGNFHRDSLERSVHLPKAQKGPDRFLEVVEAARAMVPRLKVLLAGPRRHWLRAALERRNIPFVFSGELVAGDDFSVNVLPRETLNALYSALDCVLISSRWEGGPYSALEGLFAGRPVVSTPVGMAADLLPGWLYETPAEGAALLAKVADERPDFAPLREAALKSHSPAALASALLAAYRPFASGIEPLPRSAAALLFSGLARAHKAFRFPPPSHPRVAAAMADVANGRTSDVQVVRRAVAVARAEQEVQRP